MRPIPLSVGLIPLACAAGAALLIGCAGAKDEAAPIDSGGADGGGADAGADGGEDEGTDEDGDGFTIEEGDCDDTDFTINPAFDEDPNDGVDNDCDGRVDEVWSGLAVAEQADVGMAHIVTYDTVGREGTILNLSAETTPWSITRGIDADFLMVTYPYFHNISAGFSPIASGLLLTLDDTVPLYRPAELVTVTSTDGAGGASTAVLAVFGDEGYDGCFAMPEDAWGDCFGELDPRVYFFGPYVRDVTTHPDGWYAVLTAGGLYRVDPDGSVAELGSWAWNLGVADVEPYEMYGASLDVDYATGTIGVQGLLGGFATWSEADGFVLRRPIDLAEITEAVLETLHTAIGLSWVDGDGWYGMSAQLTTGEFAIRRYDLDADDWVTEVDWIDNRLNPLGMAADGDNGDWYVTSKAGDHRSIFRVRGVDGSIDDLIDESDEGYTFWGITAMY